MTYESGLRQQDAVGVSLLPRPSCCRLAIRSELSRVNERSLKGPLDFFLLLVLTPNRALRLATAISLG